MTGETGLRIAVVRTDADLASAAEADWVVVLPPAGAEAVQTLRARGYEGSIFLLAAEGGAAVDRAAAELRRVEQRLALGERVARARHAANNPLTALLAEAQLMEMEPLAPEQREAVGRIIGLTRRVAEIIRTMGE